MKDIFYKNLDDMMSSSDLRSLMLSIGTTIRKLRIEKGYRCAEFFAFEFQLNRSAYYGWENGKNISIKKLIIVCEALGITLPEFFQLVKVPPQKKKKEMSSYVNDPEIPRNQKGRVE
jgi:transcriptional regulator with XRE-family HTH domain